MYSLFKLTNEEFEQKLLILEQIQASASEKWSREDLIIPFILWKLLIEDWKSYDLLEKVGMQLMAMPILYLLYVIAC